MNHYPSREQVQALRERYPPGTMIQLTADMCRIKSTPSTPALWPCTSTICTSWARSKSGNILPG